MSSWLLLSQVASMSSPYQIILTGSNNFFTRSSNLTDDYPTTKDPRPVTHLILTKMFILTSILGDGMIEVIVKVSCYTNGGNWMCHGQHLSFPQLFHIPSIKIIVKMLSQKFACVAVLLLVSLIFETSAFAPSFQQQSRLINSGSSKGKQTSIFQPAPTAFGSNVVSQRSKPLRDLLGLGPAEIAITLVVGLVLFGPETLKSLSKDVGRAAAELKEIPKTFKEGMDEGAESSQVAKMKALAAEKRLKRDAKRAAKEEEEDADEEDA